MNFPPEVYNRQKTLFSATRTLVQDIQDFFVRLVRDKNSLLRQRGLLINKKEEAYIAKFVAFKQSKLKESFAAQQDYLTSLIKTGGVWKAAYLELQKEVDALRDSTNKLTQDSSTDPPMKLDTSLSSLSSLSEDSSFGFEHTPPGRGPTLFAHRTEEMRDKIDFWESVGPLRRGSQVLQGKNLLAQFGTQNLRFSFENE